MASITESDAVADAVAPAAPRRAARRAPARPAPPVLADQITDQHHAPILDALRDYQHKSSTSFAPPGHQSGKSAPRDVKKLLGAQIFKADVTTLKGLDDRRERKQVRQKAERLAAQAWGAEHCFFSTGGSSLSNHVAMLAVASPGDTVLVARNSHKSVIASSIIGNVRPVFLETELDPEWEIHHGVTPDTLERAFAEHPEARAVFITSPSYYGVTSDVGALAAICHRRGVPLVVDEAWGPHFPFHPEMPMPAIRCGADVSVGSIHKTMAGLEQASIMLWNGAFVDPVRFELCYDLFESTSPSVPILATIDGSRRLYVQKGARIIGEQLRRARRARAALARIGGIRVMGPEVVGAGSRAALDETKVLIDVEGLGVTGYAAEEWLIRERQVSMAESDERHLLATFTAGTSALATRRLISAVRAMAKWARSAGKQGAARPAAMPRRRALVSELAMTPADAFYGPAEEVPLARAPGRIAAQMISPYPPGIPVLLPGERVTHAHAAYLGDALAAGAFVMDARMTNAGVVRVAADR